MFNDHNSQRPMSQHADFSGLSLSIFIFKYCVKLDLPLGIASIKASPKGLRSLDINIISLKLFYTTAHHFFIVRIMCVTSRVNRELCHSRLCVRWSGPPPIVLDSIIGLSPTVKWKIKSETKPVLSHLNLKLRPKIEMDKPYAIYSIELVARGKHQGGFFNEFGDIFGCLVFRVMFLRGRNRVWERWQFASQINTHFFCFFFCCASQVFFFALLFLRLCWESSRPNKERDHRLCLVTPEYCLLQHFV